MFTEIEKVETEIKVNNEERFVLRTTEEKVKEIKSELALRRISIQNIELQNRLRYRSTQSDCNKKIHAVNVDFLQKWLEELILGMGYKVARQNISVLEFQKGQY